jgi:hypothetical protein
MDAPLTSRELYDEIVEQLQDEGIDRAIVSDVLDALSIVAREEVANGTVFRVPGVCILTPRFVAAKPRRKGTVFATGEERWIKASPAKIRLKARPHPKVRKATPGPGSIVGKKLGKETLAKQRARAHARKSTAGARRKAA